MVEQKRVKADRSEWWHHEKNVLLIDLVKHKPVLYDISFPRYNDTIAKNSAWKEIGEHLNTSAALCKARWEQLRSQYRKKLTKNLSSVDKLRKWTYETRMSFLLPFMKERRNLPPLDESSDILMDEGVTANQYDYEIKIETVKGEARIFEDGVQDNDGVNDNDCIRDCAAQDTGPSSSTAKAFREKLANRYKKHIPSASSSIRQLLEIPPSMPSAPLMKLPPVPPIKLPYDERYDVNCRPVYETASDSIDQFFSLMSSTVKKFNAADQHFLKSKIFNLVSSVEEKYLYQDPNSLHISYSSQSPSYSEACNSQAPVMCPESINSSRPLHPSFHEIQCVQLNE